MITVIQVDKLLSTVNIRKICPISSKSYNVITSGNTVKLCYNNNCTSFDINNVEIIEGRYGTVQQALKLYAEGDRKPYTDTDLNECIIITNADPNVLDEKFRYCYWLVRKIEEVDDLDELDYFEKLYYKKEEEIDEILNNKRMVIIKNLDNA